MPVASVRWFPWIWRGYVAAATISVAAFIAVLVSVIVAEKDKSFPLMDVVPEYVSTGDGDSMRIEYDIVEEGSVSLGALLLVAFGADFIGFATGAMGLFNLQGYLAAGYHPIQLVQFTVSAAPVTVAIALVSGVTSTYALLCVVALHVLTMLSGVVAGVLSATDQHSSGPTLIQRKRRGGTAMPSHLVRWGSAAKWISHAAGWVAQAVTWFVCAQAFAAVVRISSGSPPGFVYALYIIMAVVYAWFGIAQLAVLMGTPRARIEMINVVVSPAGKLVTYGFLYTNVFAPV